MKYEHLNFTYKIMKTQPQHISNKYNTCTVVTSPVYIGSKGKHSLTSVIVQKYNMNLGIA